MLNYQRVIWMKYNDLTFWRHWNDRFFFGDSSPEGIRSASCWLQHVCFSCYMGQIQWIHKYDLVGGLEHGFYFSICWEFHHPNISQRTFIFFRGVETTNQWCFCMCLFRYRSECCCFGIELQGAKESVHVLISQDLRGARHFGRKPSWWKTAGWDLLTPDLLKMYRCSSFLLLVNWNILE